MNDRLPWGRDYLLVEPLHFDVTYHINPWMRPGVDPEAAQLQWKQLRATMERAGAGLRTARDRPGLPDMAFAMNAGFVAGTRAVPSRFRHRQRQPEEVLWRACFEDLGLEVVELPAPPEVRFEAGDAFWLDGLLVAGWGMRSDLAGVQALAEVLDRTLVPLRLVDERFYHFDTCFCPLRPGTALTFPGAFDRADHARLADAIPNLITLDEQEALTFVANSLVVEDTFITAECPPRIEAALRDLGLEVVTVDVGEFHKSGGSVRCLTLPLDVPDGAR